MCDLPTRRSVGCLYIGDYTPNEFDQAISLPQHYYIATMTCWTDPSWDERMREWMKKAYAHAAPASCGQYVADYDATQRSTPVGSTGTRQKLLICTNQCILRTGDERWGIEKISRDSPKLGSGRDVHRIPWVQIV